MKSLRVLLADDHGLARAGLRALLERNPDIEVVAEVADGAEALELIGSAQAEIVLLSTTIRGTECLDLAMRTNLAHPRVKIIFLATHATEDDVMQALRAGVVGYLLREAGPEQLYTAVRAVARGEIYLCHALSRQVIDGYMARNVVPRGLEAGRLTKRQREILKLVAEGHSTRAIADTLQVSVKTVETHRARLMERLRIRDVPGLVKYALRVGLIPLVD